LENTIQRAEPLSVNSTAALKPNFRLQAVDATDASFGQRELTAGWTPQRVTTRFPIRETVVL
jgi:hypothetical protein